MKRRKTNTRPIVGKILHQSFLYSLQKMADVSRRGNNRGHGNSRGKQHRPHTRSASKVNLKVNHKLRGATMTSAEQMLKGLRRGKKHYRKNVDVCIHPERGRTLVARRKFKSGTFIVEYEADFIDAEEGARREEMYAANREGSFVISTTWQGTRICFDATRRFNAPARLINHARGGNVKVFRPLQVKVNERPQLAMYAARPVAKGDELFWDYGLSSGETEWASFRCPKYPRFSQTETRLENIDSGDVNTDVEPSVVCRRRRLVNSYHSSNHGKTETKRSGCN